MDGWRDLVAERVGGWCGGESAGAGAGAGSKRGPPGRGIETALACDSPGEGSNRYWSRVREWCGYCFSGAGAGAGAGAGKLDQGDDTRRHGLTFHDRHNQSSSGWCEDVVPRLESREDLLAVEFPLDGSRISPSPSTS